MVKKVEEFVFFQVTNVALFRKQLKLVVPLLKTMVEVQNDMQNTRSWVIKISSGNLVPKSPFLNSVSTRYSRSSHSLYAA
jgi:hypothetical protein